MQSLKALIDQPTATFVDVRESWEFEEEHFPGAIHIPLTSVPLHLSAFRDMPKPIVLYCQSGNRSGMALRMLLAAGIEEAVNGGGLYQLKHLSKKHSDDKANKVAVW